MAIHRHNERYDYMMNKLNSLDSTSLRPVSVLLDKVLNKYGFSSFDKLHKFVISQDSFKYYLYHRDFILYFTEHYNNASVKYDNVFYDYYKPSSVLDDFEIENSNDLVFFNSLSQKEETGRNYKIFNDYMTIFDTYEKILDNSRSAYLEQKILMQFIVVCIINFVNVPIFIVDIRNIVLLSI